MLLVYLLGLWAESNDPIELIKLFLNKIYDTIKCVPYKLSTIGKSKIQGIQKILNGGPSLIFCVRKKSLHN